MSVDLVWITPNAEQMVIDMARVSNPSKQGEEGAGLLRYLLNNKHVSPFEMVNACFSIETSRDIARQILRHRSFSFQEFSQRYAEVENNYFPKEARLQDHKNRQNSIEVEDAILQERWERNQSMAWKFAYDTYKDALALGVAKEVARSVLPEGLTPSYMYMNGTLRSWIHYLQLRCGNGTQKEHMEIANQIREVLKKELPIIMELV